jgi:hypothetical protein
LLDARIPNRHPHRTQGLAKFLKSLQMCLAPAAGAAAAAPVAEIVRVR